MCRKFYRPGTSDTVEARLNPFSRYGRPHTIVAPFDVRRSSLGGWDVFGRVSGEFTYGGSLVTIALDVACEKGNRLTFRTKRDAEDAMCNVLLSANKES